MNPAELASYDARFRRNNAFPARLNRIYPVKNEDQLLKDLGNTLSADKTAVIRFFADWCPVCRADGPEFLKLVDKYPERQVTFFTINVDDHPHLVSQYKVTGVPTYFILQRNRAEVSYHSAQNVDNYLKQRRLRRRRVHTNFNTNYFNQRF